jgi:hypothetical protein
MSQLLKFYNDFFEFIKTRLSKISAETLGWLAIIALHAATVPSMLALMTGITDKAPSLDVVLMVWFSLALLFFRSVLLKDLLNIVTISVGFMVQAVFLVLIYFK